MKPIFAPFLLLPLSPVFADDHPPPRERPSLSAETQFAFEKKQPSTPAAQATSNDSFLQTHQLAPYTVKGDPHLFLFDNERRALRRIPFTWKEGGTYFRNVGKNSTTEFLFQYDPENNVVRLLNISF